MPSVQALAQDPRGVVTATVSVVGPVRVDLGAQSLGTATPASVDGHRARLLDLTGTVGAGTRQGAGSTRWVWSDDVDRTWMAGTTGYDLAEARAVVAGVRTDGDQVTLNTAATPQLRVVHQRTGAPRGGQHSHLVWCVVLFDGSAERELEVLTSITPTPPGPRTPRRRGPGWSSAQPWAPSAPPSAATPPWSGPPPTTPPRSVSRTLPPLRARDARITSVIVQTGPTTIARTLSRDDLPAVTTMIASLSDAPARTPA